MDGTSAPRFGNRIGDKTDIREGPDFASTNPARPSDVLGYFPDSGSKTIDDAVGAAVAAQRDWARVPIPARAELIARSGHALAERKDELAALIAREVGKVLAEAGGDVQEAIDMAAYVAGLGRSAWGSVFPSELGDRVCWTTRQPVGVVALITPWNFPIAIPAWKIFPALLAGNAIVLKPSELSPRCADAFADALVAAGIPAELLNVVHGAGDAGAALVTHPEVRAVSFTGSVRTGRRVAAAAAETGPRLVSLELGGKNAMIVLEDADLELAADGAIFGAFGTSGQRCTSTSRLIAQRDIASKLVDAIAERTSHLLLGDPTDPLVDIGPVIEPAATERIRGYVAAAEAEGAEVVLGGKAVNVPDCPDGSFFAPTIVRGVEPNFEIAREEVFGPVLSVLETDTVDGAVDIVNGVEYGLSAAVYTQDVSTALYAIDRIDTGIIYVNAPSIGAEIHLPFGGTKHTGNGFREAGTRGLEQFSELKSVYIDYSGRLQRAQIDNRPPITGEAT